MKSIVLLVSFLCSIPVLGQYTNFIRQVQYPGEVAWDVVVAQSGERLSLLPINPGGARFELWAVSAQGPTSYLLSSNYVGTYIPVATLRIRSEDTSAPVPRTRVDRPFYVDLVLNGLRSGDDDPEASKKVKFLRHTQSYGATGSGAGLDRTRATLVSQVMMSKNGSTTFTVPVSLVPPYGTNPVKVRGEERFTVFSLEDYQVPELEIAGQTIQVWPVADGSITGIVDNQKIRFQLPQLTIALNDLYPNSTTYLQVYPGNAALNTQGKVVPGSALVVNDSVPVSRLLIISDYASVFDEGDGIWTMELLTLTPFGLERLDYVTFDVDRTLRFNGGVSTME